MPNFLRPKIEVLINTLILKISCKNINQWLSSLRENLELAIMFNLGGLLATESIFEQFLSFQSLIICNLFFPFIISILIFGQFMA